MKRMLALMITAVSLVPLLSAGAANSGAGMRSHTNVQDVTPEVRWLWKARILGLESLNVTTPLVANDLVYLVGEDRDNHTVFVLALDAKTGEYKWRFIQQGYDLGAQGLWDLAPVMAGDVVVFEMQAKQRYGPTGLPIGRPSDYLVGVDALTGEERWRFEHSAKLTPPRAVGDSIYVGISWNDYPESKPSDQPPGAVIELDAATGKPIWQMPILDAAVWMVVTDDRTLYSLDVPQSGRGLNYIRALDLQTGQVKWRTEYRRGRDSVLPPTVSNGTLYFLADYHLNSTRVYALDAETGALKWEYVVSPHIEAALTYSFDCWGPDIHETSNFAEFAADGATVALAASVDTKKDARSEEVYLLGVEASTGMEKWRYRPFSVLEHEGFAVGAAGGYVFFGGSKSGYLYAIDAESGRPKWKIEAESVPMGKPVMAGGVLYFMNDAPSVYAIRLPSGETR